MIRVMTSRQIQNDNYLLRSNTHMLSKIQRDIHNQRVNCHQSQGTSTELLISYGLKFDTQCLKIVRPFVMVYKPRRLKVTKPPKTMRVAEIPMRIRLIFLTVIKLVRACENFWNKEKRTEREIVNLLLFDPHICKPKCSSVIKHKQKLCYLINYFVHMILQPSIEPKHTLVHKLIMNTPNLSFI